VRYVPGAKGVDIGGDWYSVIAVDTTRFAFVVGDVSGRGLSAATIMAGLRYTIRAYALEGYSPTEILEKCANQLHVVVDGHFATVLVGLGDTATCEVTLANAGHFNPLVVDGTEADFVATQLGVPLGVQGGVYPSVVVPMAPGSTMIAFTDGLVERRTESLDVGLKRLAEAALSAQGSLDDLLTTLIRDLTSDASEDDIAILALRWRS
jgi:serine phosphatase RsbU (regulator of sigma subunit)